MCEVMGILKFMFFEIKFFFEIYGYGCKNGLLIDILIFGIFGD